VTRLPRRWPETVTNQVPKMGSISCGTLRSKDLVRSFTSEYERLGGRPSNIRHFDNVIIGNNLSASHDEELTWALEDLFELLNEMAPEGSYFGAHEGDGADFGFWLLSEGA
jgi:hypothetical protein